MTSNDQQMSRAGTKEEACVSQPHEPARRARSASVARLRTMLALLPVRFDDWRFWPRAAMGVALRAGVLAGSWWTLREWTAQAVSGLLSLLTVATLPVDRTSFAVGDAIVEVSVSCTHLEVAALLAPLLWDRTRRAMGNVGVIVAFVSAVVGAAVLRIALAVVLLRVGVPWTWGHDGLLGIFYFVVMALTLRAGVWTRPPLEGPTARRA